MISDTTSDIRVRSVEALPYKRSAVTVGIVQFGASAFYRTHVAEYVDDLLAAGVTNAGICMVGVMPSDLPRVDDLAQQDGLYTRIIVDDRTASSIRLIGSVLEVMHATQDDSAVMERLTRPEVHTVTLTITEGGYPIDRDTGHITLDPEAVQASLDGSYAPGATFGFIIRALAARRHQGIAPFAVLSCDNVPNNGDITKTVLTEMAAVTDQDLSVWINNHVACPNAMVDRITPATTDADRQQLLSTHGITDRWPAVCEPYRQWVVEGTGIPAAFPLHLTDATLTDDVRPFESAKLRLLNGGHQVLAHLGAALGLNFVHQAVADPIVRDVLSTYLRTEARPTLKPAPGVDFAQYEATLLDRFANSAIRDPLARICTDSSDRLPKWVVPVISENARLGRSTIYGTFTLALWRHSVAANSVADRQLSRLAPLAANDDPLAFLDVPELFGDLMQLPTVRDQFVTLAAQLTTVGPQATARSINDRAKR